jgi:hypothetical protein
MRSFRFVMTAAVTASAALVVALPAAAQGDFSWRGTLRAGQTVEIKGINGAIVAVPARGSEVRVTAVKKDGRRGDADDVRIEAVPHDGGITICAVYPDSRERNVCAPGRGGRLNARDNDTRVEFHVEVPGDVRFSATNVNGKVSATGLTGNVAASTVNGGVEVSTAGLASASSVNGSIHVSMARANWQGELEFETVNGSIEVEIGAADLNTEVRASTVNGSISTDWPLTIQGRFGPKRLNGTIGNGGRTLSLSTVNGSISLIKG